MDRSQIAGVGFVVLGLFQMTPFAVVVGGQRIDTFLLLLAAAGVAITAMGGLMVYRGSDVTDASRRERIESRLPPLDVPRVGSAAP